MGMSESNPYSLCESIAIKIISCLFYVKVLQYSLLPSEYNIGFSRNKSSESISAASYW